MIGICHVVVTLVISRLAIHNWPIIYLRPVRWPITWKVVVSEGVIIIVVVIIVVIVIASVASMTSVFC